MRTLSLSTAFVLTCASCQHDGQPVVGSAAQGSILFVHGAFQNAEVWDDVRASLRPMGFETQALTLPRTVTPTGPRLAEYARLIVEAGQAMARPTWLVVHSFGGVHGTAAAAAQNEPFEGVIYVAAYAPEPGESMQMLAAKDTTNRFTEKNFVVTVDFKYASVLSEDRSMLFCNDCPPVLARRVAQGLVREPLGPVAEAVQFDAEGLADDRRGYIITTRDNAVGTKLQREMAERAGIRNLVEIDTGHSPFFSQPQELAQRIAEVIERSPDP